jgi:hypothetical protein
MGDSGWLMPESLMASSLGISAASSLASAYGQSSAQRAQGVYLKAQADTNARLAMLNAEDAIRRGDLQSGVARRKGSAVSGAQKVAAAAQGVDINSGSAAALQKETEQLSEIDIQTIKNNAWKEAWGFKVQSEQYSSQGRYAEMAARNAAHGTMLTGGLAALSYGIKAASYYQKAKPPEPDVKDPRPAKMLPGPDGEPVQDSPQSKAISDATNEARAKRRSKENPLGYDDLIDSWWVS